MTREHTPEQLARWRRDLAGKGMEWNAALTAILAGKNVTLATLQLPNAQKPGERKEEQLRRLLDRVSRAQKRLGTPAWGLCVQCGGPLREAMLDEAPWTETCAACSTT